LINTQNYLNSAPKIGFYVLGKKGFGALNCFILKYGAEGVSFVVAAKDNGVEDDWYKEIYELCQAKGVVFRTKGQADEKKLPFAKFKFAVGWRWIIQDDTNLLVFHDSLLPKYRGFAPLVNMLIEGEVKIGVSALLASNEYDKGELVGQAGIDISYPIKIENAINKIIPLYAELILKISQDIFDLKKLNSWPQNETLSSYSLWRDERDYFIDWTQSAAKIRRFIDAVGYPYLGASSNLDGAVVRLSDAEVLPDVQVENRTACAGKIIFMQNSCPVIVCGIGLLKINNLISCDGKSLIGFINFRSRFESFK
jgi:methionyl-tRNA formyltransferase